MTVVNADELVLERVRVPGDLSSAAFMVTAGVLVPGSRLLIGDVGVNWTRTGFLRILRRMQGIVLGDLEDESGELSADEPISDLDVAHGALEGTVVESEEVPLAIDELPLVALLGCFAEGETVVQGAQELRVKESDRIADVVEGLRGLGAEIEATEDGFAVRGTGGLRGGTIEARGDHRLAMLGAVAGLASREGVEVVGMEAAAVSYPGFVEDLAGLVLVAIDGPAGAGKSTVARAVARRLGFTYLDSGAMYRCVALLSLASPGTAIGRAGPRGANRAGRALRRHNGVCKRAREYTGAARRPRRDRGDPHAGGHPRTASRVAADPGVRAALVATQRALIARGDWVAEGRDIGTVVAPEAELKVFLTASPEERARRRAAELGRRPAHGARRADAARRARRHA